MALSREQLSLIHVAKTKLCMEDADYRAILKHMGGVDSSKNLNQPGFLRVMDAFSRLGFHSDFSTKNFGERATMATPRQVALIRSLWGEYTAGEGTDKTLGKWIERTFKVGSLRFVDAGTARKVIAALKAMKAKRKTDTIVA